MAKITNAVQIEVKETPASRKHIVFCNHSLNGGEIMTE